MRTHLPLLALLAHAACFSSSDGGDDSGGGGFGFGDGGGDGGGGDGGSNEGTFDILEPGTPAFAATFTSESFAGEPGYWAFSEGTSLRADQDDGAIQILIQLEGDVRDGRSLAVTSAQWTRSVYSDADNDYDYEGEGDGSQTFTVEAMDSEGDYLWGSMDGSIDMTDSMGGGTVTLSGLELESWPKFGA